MRNFEDQKFCVGHQCGGQTFTSNGVVDIVGKKKLNLAREIAKIQTQDAWQQIVAIEFEDWKQRQRSTSKSIHVNKCSVVFTNCCSSSWIIVDCDID